MKKNHPPRGPNGGKRPGAGRPKGRKCAKTLSKELARERVRELVTAQLEPLITAQLANAQGLKYLVTRDKKTGKFIRVTEAMAKHKSQHSSDEETIEVWEKDPNIQAFTDLLNRALDRPKEQPQEVNVTGQLDIVGILRARRDRRKA